MKDRAWLVKRKEIKKMRADRNSKIYGFEACMESVTTYIETFKEDPIKLLGEYTLREKQDPFFNTLMIDALLEYIEAHNIKWND
jgi:hypothetical protein